MSLVWREWQSTKHCWGGSETTDDEGKFGNCSGHTGDTLSWRFGQHVATGRRNYGRVSEKKIDGGRKSYHAIPSFSFRSADLRKSILDCL